MLKEEKKLLLEPREKGYEILLIEPYYKSILDFCESYNYNKRINLLCSPIFLTYLDLYHFPLRGKEQSQFIFQRDKIFKKIYKSRK